MQVAILGDRTADGARAAKRSLRPEIQLLRAVAVSAVVANHVWPGALPGGYLGVDMFFVISGYLITAHPLREAERTGTIRLRAFWGRRVRRLLPASLLVIAVSAVASVVVLPAAEWPMVFRQVTASALYVQNWALAADAQDYFASAQSPSPLTHYWSLSVEEQFYLVWPLLVLGTYVVGRRLGRSRLTVAVLLGVVVASLAFSVRVTATDPGAAYFVTPARMWQLGVGGLLAILPTMPRGRHAAPPRGRHVVALAGWAAVVASVLTFDEGSPVPGWVTLLPVLGTAAVIWGGDAFLRTVPRAARPLLAVGLWLGAISYSLYLWHWPPVVLLPAALGRPLSPVEQVVLVVLVVLLAWATLTLVENPVREHRWAARGPLWRTFLPATVATSLVVGFATYTGASVDQRTETVREQVTTALESGDRCFGARAVANGCPEPNRLRYRNAALLRVENTQFSPSWGESCLQNPREAAVVSCQYGVPPTEADRRVVLVGDSHARHWAAAVEEIALRRKWNVTLIAKSSCPVNAEAPRTRRFPEFVPSCRAWNDAVVDRVLGSRADLVITSASSRNYVLPGLEGREATYRMAEGYAAVWRRWASAGKTVVALGDVPRMWRGDIPACVMRAGTRDDPCWSPSSRADSLDPLLVAAERSDPRRVLGVDLSRFFCSDGRCHSVIGGIVAYGDTNHMLEYFARSLAPYLEDELRPVL